MATFWGRVMAGVRAFRQAWLTSGDPEWLAWDARRFRYELQWSYYESNTYIEQIHSWARLLKGERALYRYIRNIYSPMYGLGEFHATHLWGGALDPAAGDGKATPSALPIIVGERAASVDEGLRAAISELWKWSNWGSQKDVVTLQGAVKGDVGIRVVADVERERVYLEPIMPEIIKYIDLDPFGNVKAYTLEEEVLITVSRAGKQIEETVTRTEIVTRNDGAVVFTTLKDGREFDFDGQGAVRETDWGFIPFVLIQHNNVGEDWGWGEGWPQLSKLMEIDDQSSLLSDQLRKIVNAPWFFSGVKKGDIALTATQDDTAGTDGRTRRQAGREDMPSIMATSPDAKAKALVADLKIEEMAKRTAGIIEALEGNYPELSFEKLRRRGEISGMALRVARQPAETKVRKRRVNYDAALVRAQQMAIAIGGHEGYEGYDGFGLDSFDAGLLDHSIGDRPVFDPDEFELAETDKLLWDGALSAVRAGVSLSWYLRRQKIKPLTEDDISELMDGPEAEAIRAARQLQALGMTGVQEEEEE